MRQVARDDSVVRRNRMQVRGEARKALGAVLVAPAPAPGEIAEDAFPRELAGGRAERIREVRIGDLRETERGGCGRVHAAASSFA